jgi:GNAT superfamily N-acetyltransferase
MEKNDYHIKTITRDRLDLALEWAAEEGWNPGIHDADPFFAADPEGFFMGFLNGEPISCVSAVRYGETFGFAGFFMVTHEHRGKVYGFEIGQRALAHLEGRLIGLDGVVAQQANYQKAGFALVHRNIRYEGVGTGEPESHPEVVSLQEIPFEKISACDAGFFPERRDAFLESWISRPQTVALGIRRKGNLAGYGVLRPCRSGYKIGPLFAPDAGSADSLLRSLLGQVRKGSPVFLDVPEINPSAVALAEAHGMKTVFETARMYNGQPPHLPLNEIFGITTFELG